MATVETPEQRAARLHAQALAAWQANKEAMVHQVPGYSVAQGAPVGPPKRPGAPDQRNFIQRILDGLGGNP